MEQPTSTASARVSSSLGKQGVTNRLPGRILTAYDCAVRRAEKAQRRFAESGRLPSDLYPQIVEEIRP